MSAGAAAGRRASAPGRPATLGVRGARPLTATIAAVAIAFTAAASASARPAALIRVDQVGYAQTAPKRAYLIAHGPEAGVAFTVRSQNEAVALRASVGPALGAWNARYPYVYALDFDSVQAPGSYTLVLEGRRQVRSPPFAIAPAQALYRAPLENALSFYEDERDGPEFIPSALRSAPAHLNDEHARTYLTPKVNAQGEFHGELTSLEATIDAAGGWWDAGDYLKFVETTSYAVDLQLIGVRDFPAQLGASAPASDFTEEARFGTEWLLRMWDDPSRTLYYQVGIGEGNANTAGDHDIWRLPQQDDSYGGSDPRFRYIRNRPVFRAGPPGSPVSPNLAGRDAAAFALCFEVFARSRPALADSCLLAGEHIYELADTSPKGRLLTTLPYDFYPETEWRDDLELGATELARALASGQPLPAGLPHGEALYYLRQAAEWAHAYLVHARGGGEGLNLYDVSGLADYELIRALRQAGNPPAMAVSESQLLAGLRRQLDNALELAARDPFGFGYPWRGPDTVSHGDGLAVMASEYQSLTGESAYGVLAQRWLANMLGANAWGASFIIGDGTTFPDCPQHQVANLVGSLDGMAPVLAGAVVEGPAEEASKGRLPGMRTCPPHGGNPFARFDGAGAVYRDDVQSYTTDEPAIDLTASSLLAFAWQASGG